MGAIVAKFGSAMSGFWWALDEQERRVVIIAGCWLAAMLVNVPLEQRRRARQRDEITAQVLEELRSAHA